MSLSYSIHFSVVKQPLREARLLGFVRLGQLHDVCAGGLEDRARRIVRDPQITSATSSGRVNRPPSSLANPPVTLSKTLRAKSAYASGTATPCLCIWACAF